MNAAQYELIFAATFDKRFKRLDRQIQERVMDKLYALTFLDDPTKQCKPLTGDLAGL